MQVDPDLQTLAELAAALWVAPEEARPVVVETLSAVSLLELSQDKAIERATAVLLKRAEARGAIAATRSALSRGQFGAPFFMLSPAERFTLVALHSGRWSYARISRIMNIAEDEVEALAWRSRQLLGADAGLIAAGPKTLGVSCPEYDFEKPWTQRFLDEEISGGQQRMFLRNHLMACDVCRTALNRCRDLYFTAEKMLPVLNVEENGSLLRELAAIQRKGLVFRRSSMITFWDAWAALFRQRDVQLMAALGVALLFYRYFHI
jgi:hypothetical protein